MRIRCAVAGLGLLECSGYAGHSIVAEDIDVGSALLQELLEDRHGDAEAVERLACALAPPKQLAPHFGQLDRASACVEGELAQAIAVGLRRGLALGIRFMYERQVARCEGHACSKGRGGRHLT